MRAAEACYCGGREECLALAKQLAFAAGVPEETAYTALVLLDYCLVAGMPFPQVSHLSLLVMVQTAWDLPEGCRAARLKHRI
jgi:hypothetical protein